MEKASVVSVTVPPSVVESNALPLALHCPITPLGPMSESIAAMSVSRLAAPTAILSPLSLVSPNATAAPHHPFGMQSNSSNGSISCGPLNGRSVSATLKLPASLLSCKKGSLFPPTLLLPKEKTAMRMTTPTYLTTSLWRELSPRRESHFNASATSAEVKPDAAGAMNPLQPILHQQRRWKSVLAPPTRHGRPDAADGVSPLSLCVTSPVILSMSLSVLDGDRFTPMPLSTAVADPHIFSLSTAPLSNGSTVVSPVEGPSRQPRRATLSSALPPAMTREAVGSQRRLSVGHGAPAHACLPTFYAQQLGDGGSPGSTASRSRGGATRRGQAIRGRRRVSKKCDHDGTPTPGRSEPRTPIRRLFVRPPYAALKPSTATEPPSSKSVTPQPSSEVVDPSLSSVVDLPSFLSVSVNSRSGKIGDQHGAWWHSSSPRRAASEELRQVPIESGTAQHRAVSLIWTPVPHMAESRFRVSFAPHNGSSVLNANQSTIGDQTTIMVNRSPSGYSANGSTSGFSNYSVIRNMSPASQKDAKCYRLPDSTSPFGMLNRYGPP